MFEKASRLKLRFYYNRFITTEDLWDLGLSELDSIYKSMNHSFKSLKVDNRVMKKDDLLECMKLKFAIIKHIYDVKVVESNTILAEEAKDEKMPMD
jgi:hypothetical protein